MRKKQKQQSESKSPTKKQNSAQQDDFTHSNGRGQSQAEADRSRAPNQKPAQRGKLNTLSAAPTQDVINEPLDSRANLKNPTQNAAEKRTTGPANIEHSFKAVFLTALDYVMSDLRKKQKQFKIGVMTIFLVVGFVTFLDSLVQLAPAVFMMTSQTSQGDFDLKLSLRSRSEQMVLSNQNFFTQDIELFNYKRISDYQLQQGEISDVERSFQLPVLNFTDIDMRLKDSEHYAGAFPRWTALGRAINPKDTTKHTSAFTIIADTKLERDIGVAYGFPNTILNRHELMAIDDLLHILGLKEGDTVELNFDLFQIAAFDFSKLKRMIFDFDTFNSTYSQGQTVLDYLGINSHLKFDPTKYLSQRMIEDFFDKYRESDQDNQMKQIAQGILEKIQGKEEILLSEILEVLIRHLKEEDFILKKNYTLVKGVSQTYGKWPSIYGNALLIDSNYIFEDFALMLRDNLLTLARNNGNGDKYDEVIHQMHDIGQKGLAQKNINDFAINVMVHMKDRKSYYLRDRKEFKKIVNKIAYPLSLTTNVTISTPIIESMEQMKIITHLLDNFLFMIVFFLCLISFILIFSLMQSDVEERTYEFAMLRTLGLRNRNLIVLLSIQAALFSIPGLFLGFIINFICMNGAQVVLYVFADYATVIEMKPRTVYLGLMLGILLPLMSNIIPMKQALGNSLRNALDQFRSGVDEFEVQMVRMANFGISVNQLIVSVTLLACGAMTYYYVPRAYLNGDIGQFSFMINLLLVLLIIGMIMIAQVLVPVLENFLLTIFILVRPQDKKMKPIVQKNLKSHGSRNLKTSLMFTVTLSFLVFSGANFKQIHFFLVSLAKSISGSDLTATKVSFSHSEEQSVLDEFKLKEFMEENTISRGGLIESYSFHTQNLEKILEVKDFGRMLPCIKHSGMGFRKQRIKAFGIDRNILETVDTKYYYPTEYMNDPYGVGKDYNPLQVVDMLYDIEEYSKIYTRYDEFDVVSGNPNKDLYLDTEMYNMISPEGLRGLIFEHAGEHNILCIGDPTPGDLYRIHIDQPMDCKVKLKTRSAALAIKFPGFASYTGYQHAKHFKTPHFFSMGQLRKILDEVFIRYPKRQEAFLKKLEDIPKSSYDLPKNRLFIRLQSNSTRFQRGVLMNNLLNFIKDETVLVFDRQSFIEDINERMILLDIFNAAVSIICFALGLFQLIVSISANIRDSMWELGVLRAMGMTKVEIMRITIYESMANNLSSIILGFSIGLLIAISLMAQFLLFLEMPFELVLPSKTFAFLALMSIATMALGSYIGTRSLYKKQIASVLKGIN